MRKFDNQVVELFGRNRLATELLRAGLEVAFPARDRGIDLIAYADLSKKVKQFVARPIQMKAARGRSFYINKRFKRVADLIIAYVCNLGTPEEAVTYALTWKEAFDVAKIMGVTRTPIWKKRGMWRVGNPGRRWQSLLASYEMTPDKWYRKVTGR